ncbi:hypothetical protein [Alicyclobacillus sendaiensis]|uniref:hypothetical protein n=1 Tax=Alicyclobacillus sendaiensis TaxID=192387 RepID=UPI0012EE3AB5|nr:hypothetical protein [Alicyclobacillus sendaiensis]
MNEQLGPGTRVRWFIRRRGERMQMTGTVIAFVPAGHSALAYAPKGTPEHFLKAKNMAKVDRYLVEVRPSFNVWLYYCPRASQIEIDE